MPIISDAAWDGTGKWLRVKRILFTSQVGDKAEVDVPYTSSNPLVFDTTVDPGAGILVWNNVDPALITQIAVSTTDDEAGDQTVAWDAIKIGDRITVTQDAGRYFIVDATTVAVDMGGWYQIDVVFKFAVGLIQNNKTLDVHLVYFPESIPSGGDTLQIKMAQEWPWIVYRIFDPASIVPKQRGVIPISDVSLIEME